MSDRLQPGLHPDADVLNAFAENALPAHARTHTLAHLADCAYCREIVFLAQQAAPVPESAPAFAWQRWLNSVPLFGIGIGAAALAGLALLFVTLRSHPNTAPSVAMHEPQILQPPAPAAPAVPATPHPPDSASALKGTGPTQPSPESAMKGTGFSPYDNAERRARALAPEGVPRALAKPVPPALAKIEPPRPSAGPPRPLGLMGMGVGRAPIVGMAAPPRPMAMSSSHGDAAPRAAMPQSVNGLAGEPAAGALATATQPTAVTLGSAAPAAAAPAPPAVSETVTVQGAEQALSMDSSAATGTLLAEAPKAVMAKKRNLQTSPSALPSNLPTTWLISSGPRTLAADTAGALFLSLDAGRHWQTVAPSWPGKVTQLKLAVAPAVFQLITTTGAVWFSADGLHWQPQ